MALVMSEAMGTIVNQNGDLYSNKQSQLGDGLYNLYQNNIDLKKFYYEFGDDSGVIEDAAIGIDAALASVTLLNTFAGQPLVVTMKLAVLATQSYVLAQLIADRYSNYLMAHGLILKKVYEEHLIDKALEDYINVGGGWKDSSAKDNISSQSIDSATAGFPAPDQAFALLSDRSLEHNEQSIGVFRAVT